MFEYETDTRYPVPFKAYPIKTDGNTQLYDDNENPYDINKRFIEPQDLCTITRVYADGFVKVSYPTSSGTPRTAKAELSSFVSDPIEPYTMSPSEKSPSYTRSDMNEEFGEVFVTDKCTAVGCNGNRLQVIYPVTGGYKLGWIYYQTETAEEYKLTVDANGGKMKDGKTVYTPESTDPQLTYGSSNYCGIAWLTPQREGYTFTGWTSEKNGGVLVYDQSGNCTNEGVYWRDEAYCYNGDLTVYAQWKADPVAATTAVTTTKAATITTVSKTTATDARTTAKVTTSAEIQLSIDKTSLTLENGQQYTIRANQSGLVYKSNNTDVAVVSKTGVVTAIGEGEAVISVINSDGDAVQLRVTVIAVGVSGDANGDGKVNVADAVAVLQYVANKSKYSLTEQGEANADCDGVKGITGGDAKYIQMMDAGII